MTVPAKPGHGVRVAQGDEEEGRTQRPPWIDRRMQELPPQPWRKIHLDFHNTPFVGAVGDSCDPEHFVDRLRAAHVDSIVVFAKDMHGYFYFPSKRGPVHPGLSRDLLGEQVAQCRSAGIAVYGYYCVTWDNVMAEEHPEWLAIKRDRTNYLPRFDETPAWTALCLSNEDLVEVMLQDSREVLSRYEMDGMWYDMPLPIGGECYCRNCLRAIRAAGKDPFHVTVQRAHKQELLIGFLRRVREVADEVRPGCQIDQNNQTRLGLGERIGYFDNVDIEALPTGGWGYQYFPVDVRYARGFGKSVFGQTGRFHQSWADFGGLKHPRQLEVELAAIVAQGARCCIGDQAPPSARLDRAVYETIGGAYERIERIQYLLEGAAPVVEAAILIDGLPLLDPGATRTGSASPEAVDPMVEGVVGMAELLVDNRVQFDVVEPDVDLDRYRLLLVPGGSAVDERLASRLRGYVDAGGAVLAFGSAATVEGEGPVWLPGCAVSSAGASPFVPSYFIPEAPLLGCLSRFEYALYLGTEVWRVEDDTTEVWAELGVPAFQRSPKHYTSHAQSPFAQATGDAVVVRRGRVGAAAFDVGRTYHRTGYWPYREVFAALLEAVLPERLVRSDAPASVELSLTQQRAAGGSRWLLHAVNESTGRRWGPRLERFEDPISLPGFSVTLELPGELTGALVAGSGEPLALKRVKAVPGGSRVNVELPRLETSCVVVLEASQVG